MLEQQRRDEAQRSPAATAPGTTTPTSPLSDARPPEPAASASAIADTSRITVREFRLRGHTLASTEALQQLLRPWLGRPLALTELRQASSALEQHYRSLGWLASVTLPAQDVTDGLVRLDVTEARLGQVRLADGHSAGTATAPSPRVAEGLVRRVRALMQARLLSGAPLNLATLEHALLLADELPGVRVSGSLQAGSAPGSTDVLLQLSPQPSLRADVGLDNAASLSTGAVRASASLTLDAPWGQGEQLGLALSRSAGSSYLRASASLPVGDHGWRWALNASALSYQVRDAHNSSTGLAPKAAAPASAWRPATHCCAAPPRAGRSTSASTPSTSATSMTTSASVCLRPAAAHAAAPSAPA